MPYVLRKISRAKWFDVASESSGTQQPPDESLMQADVFSDLKTDSNQLSVWYIDDDLANLDHVLTALAANLDRLSNVDYVLLNNDVVMALNLGIKQTDGGSLDQQVNQWHRDLDIRTAGRLVDFAKEIYSRADSRRRKPEKELKRLLVRAVSSGRIDKDKLKESLREEVDKLLGSSGGDKKLSETI